MKKAKAYPNTFITDEFSLEAVTESISKKKHSEELFTKLQITSVVIIIIVVFAFALTPIFMIIKNKIQSKWHLYKETKSHISHDEDSGSDDDDDLDVDKSKDISYNNTVNNVSNSIDM